jgi:uncharacterized protein YbjT (DUF2867 family)
MKPLRRSQSKTDCQALERALEAAGFPHTAGRSGRFMSGWYQSLYLIPAERTREPAVGMLRKTAGPGNRACQRES